MELVRPTTVSGKQVHKMKIPKNINHKKKLCILCKLLPFISTDYKYSPFWLIDTHCESANNRNVTAATVTVLYHMHLLHTASSRPAIHTDEEESCGDVPLYSPGLPRKTDEYKTPLRASFAAATRASAGEGHSRRVVHHFPAQTNDRYQQLNSATNFRNWQTKLAHPYTAQKHIISFEDWT